MLGLVKVMVSLFEDEEGALEGQPHFSRHSPSPVPGPNNYTYDTYVINKSCEVFHLPQGFYINPRL